MSSVMDYNDYITVYFVSFVLMISVDALVLKLTTKLSCFCCVFLAAMLKLATGTPTLHFS